MAASLAEGSQSPLAVKERSDIRARIVQRDALIAEQSDKRCHEAARHSAWRKLVATTPRKPQSPELANSVASRTWGVLGENTVGAARGVEWESPKTGQQRDQRSIAWRGIAGSSSSTVACPWQDHTSRLWTGVDARSSPKAQPAKVPCVALMPPPCVPPPNLAEQTALEEAGRVNRHSRTAAALTADSDSFETDLRSATAPNDEDGRDPRLLEEEAWRGVVSWNREAVKVDRMHRETNERRRDQSLRFSQLTDRAVEAKLKLSTRKEELAAFRASQAVGPDTSVRMAQSIRRDVEDYHTWARQSRAEREEMRAADVQEKLEDFRAMVFARPQPPQSAR